MRALFVCLFTAVILCCSNHAFCAEGLPPQPTEHTLRQVEGWTVHVDNRLLDGPDHELGERAMKMLAHRLYQITLVLAPEKVERLRQVHVYLDRTCGGLDRAQYHPSAEWLSQHGYDKAMARCVHIPSAAGFVSQRFQYDQPWAVMHELAHAYHDQVLGFDDPEIKAAWRHFVDGGKYKAVLHINGRHVLHYALTNEREFFAEMTESYLGMNDFYPFNSAELRRDEPEIFKLLEKIWGPLP
jgi:hypothetical protein